MVVTECKTACGPGRNGAKLGFNCHADSLGSGVAITNLGNVPPHGFGVPVVDDGEQPDLAIHYGRDLRCVGAPHQPQHPLAGNSNAVKHAQPRPYFAMTLTNPGRTVEIGSDCTQHLASEIAGLGPRRDPVADDMPCRRRHVKR